MKFYHSIIEPLESRIAPAAVFVSATTGTYTDVDGDHVTVKFSLPILTPGNVTSVLETAAVGSGDQLQEINLTSNQITVPVTGTSIAFSVVHEPGADGLANVGFIDAAGITLGAVTVKGDLGRITAGSGSATIPAIKSLSVNSLGRVGLDSQGGSGSLESDIDGTLGSLTVTSDDTGAYINVSNGGIGPITIGGSLIGGTGASSGEIISSGNMGAVKIGHDMQGGAGGNSGFILSGGTLTGVGNIDDAVSSGGTAGIISKIASITIGGQVFGTPASVNNSDNFGFVTAAIGPVKIGGYTMPIAGNAPQPVGETGDVDIHILS